MSRLSKFGCWLLGLGLLLSSPRSASGFAFYGPAEGFQVGVLGYDTRVGSTLFPGDFVWTTFLSPEFANLPKNLGEEFRWNMPTLYYAYDQSFLDYFGSNGVAAVDSAVGILNNLTNVSSYSVDLSEFPLTEGAINYTASALHLLDLKSAALEMLVERLGLADPERWAWCLRSRLPIPGLPCPGFQYSVIQRNFDPVTLVPSRYVNGNLFTYTIIQLCPPPVDFGDPEEFLVDPDGDYQTAVASPKITVPNLFYYGKFHTGLTRDDVGGLRYLYRASNRNQENSGPNTTVFIPDNTSIQLLFPTNGYLLAAESLTNNAATLQTLFPNLIVTSTTNIFTNILTLTVFAYFTNYPYDPVGTPAHLAFATNSSYVATVLFHHTFGNLVSIIRTNGAYITVPVTDIFQLTNRQIVSVQTITITNSPLAPVGSPPVTNVSTKFFSSNSIPADVYILPTNACDLLVLGPQLTNVFTLTNTFIATNGAGVSNVNSQSFTQNTIFYFTNHIYVVEPVVCQQNTVAMRQGVERIQFVRRDFDSLIGRFFTPITNTYTLTEITNNVAVPRKVQRAVTAPDIVFSAADLNGGVNGLPYIPDVNRQTPNFNATNALPGLAGPGTIEPPVQLTFNKVGPIYLNGIFPSFIDEQNAVLDFIWGSFDFTTNAPIVYPVGTSIYALEAQVLMQIDPPELPLGNFNQPYTFSYTNQVTGAAFSNTLSVTGGQPPYTWTLSPGSPNLPPGLFLGADGSLTGTPIQTGTFDFFVRVTDAGARFIDRSYSVTIIP